MLSEKDWHSLVIGAVVTPVPGNETCPGIAPRRLDSRDGAWVVRRDAAINRMEIPMSKPSSKPAKTRSPKSKPAAAIPSKLSQSALVRSDFVNGSDAPSNKKTRVLTMLQSTGGTTIAAMMQATGWQQHSVRGFLAGVVRKKMNLKLESKKVDGNRIYRIDRAATPKAIRPRPKRRVA
jgi:hypothetical protein